MSDQVQLAIVALVSSIITIIGTLTYQRKKNGGNGDKKV